VIYPLLSVADRIVLSTLERPTPFLPSRLANCRRPSCLQGHLEALRCGLHFYPALVLMPLTNLIGSSLKGAATLQRLNSLQSVEHHLLRSLRIFRYSDLVVTSISVHRRVITQRSSQTP